MNTTIPSVASRRPAIFCGAGALAVGLTAAIALSAAPSDAAVGGKGKLRQPSSKGPAAAFAPVDPDRLSSTDVAFSGKVVKITGETVTLKVKDRYIDAVHDRYVVPQGIDTEVDGGPLRFKKGKTYLISVRDNRIETCGISDLETPELKAIYENAFQTVDDYGTPQVEDHGSPKPRQDRAA